MEPKLSQKKLLIRKLQNVLRGDASSVIESLGMPNDERTERMAIIEELKLFLDDYDNNIAILKKFKEKNIER